MMRTEDTAPGALTCGELLLKRDSVWGAFTSGGSLDAFMDAHPPFRFRPAVPEAIRRKLAVVHKLILHSYFEYEFLDIAFVRAMQLVEMALRVRHKEIEGEDAPKRCSMRSLIEWAVPKGLMEESLKQTDLLREIRNFAIHAKAETVYGISIVQTIYTVVDFINELYEDVEHRIRRQAKEREVQEALSRAIAGGAILTAEGARIIIFDARVLYCALLGDAFDLHVAFVPIFDPKEVSGETRLPEPIFVACQGYAVRGAIVELIDHARKHASVQPITDKVNIDRYQKFLTEFESRPILRPPIQVALADRRRAIVRSMIKDEEN